ncbi:MAG TPA: hypothetical protein VHX88_11420 [Solirubrobacteraceae bacterium]|nr:hypothetical protein [Solirubrobacteraceae bacterium]
MSDEARRVCCADCQRTPLAGERVYHYDGGGIVCELCRALRPGEPRSSALVRHSEAGHTVRLTVRATRSSDRAQ